MDFPYRFKNFFIQAAAILFLIFNSCSNSVEPDENLLMSQIPVIKGINITGNWGGRPIDLFAWRKPDYSPDEKYTNQRLNMSNPYPNPSSTWIRFEFTAGNSQEIVSLWLAKGILPEENWGRQPLQSTAGACIVPGTDEKPYIIHLIKNEILSDYTSVTWYGFDEEQKEAPGGFYRVYLKIGKILLWRDILYARSIDDAPDGLKHYLTFHE